MVGKNLTPRTSYRPQTDGQTNKMNQWLEGYLRNYVSGKQEAWIKWLHWGEFFSIIVLFIFPLECVISKKFMVMMHPILLTTFFVIVYHQRLRIGFKKVG